MRLGDEMALTEADRRRINREIDEETNRRLARAGYNPPELREPERTAAQVKKLSDDAWNSWVNTMIDQRLSAGVIPAVGIAIAKKAKELRDEMAALAEEAGAAAGDADCRIMALEAELADVRTAFAEVRNRLTAYEGRLARVTADGESKAAPLALPPPGWIGTA
jgi:hypothetical protein